MRGINGDGPDFQIAMTVEPDDDRTVISKPTVQPAAASATSVGRGVLSPGQVLGNTFEIEALLARGGMGAVYRARHLELGSIHAIKLILPEFAEDTHIITLFQEEARKLRRVRSDAIVAYEGLSRDESGARYLVMEFVDGPSLAQLLKSGKLSVDQVRALRDRCASGLAVAHDKGIFHRDISPDNIILVDGKVEQAKIIDFGIAKSSDPGDRTVVGGDFAGKYSYVSPEQLGMYGGKVDGRSDIYSLGLVLVAAARGRSIDMGNSPASVIEKRQGLPDLSGIPAELRDELTPLLEPDPAKRPSSMRHLPGVAIDAAGATVMPTRQAPVATSAAPKPKQWLVPVVAGVVAFGIIVGGGAYLLYPTQHAPEPTPYKTAESKPPISIPNPGSGTAAPPEAHPATTTTSIPISPPAQMQPTEEAHVAVPPPAPGAAAVQSQLQTILSRFDCAGLTGQVGDDLHGTVRGFVKASDLPQLRAAVAGLGSGVAISTDAVTGMVWPHCAVASLFATATSESSTTPRIALNNPSGQYHNKDKLVIDLTVPAGGGFLQVDFYDSSGSVQHIYPSAAVRPGQQIELGKDGSYQIGAPFGPNMIAAIISPQRLFPSRPAEENARAYIADLQARIKSIGGAQIASNYAMLDTLP